MAWFGFRPYVPVAIRRSRAANYGKTLAKKRGTPLTPVNIQGRKITTTFWGDAWCANLEQYSDFANRLPRGRTYVRNGSVIDLKITAGEVVALVSGSDVYTIKIQIGRLSRDRWQTLCAACADEVDSLFDLLQGRLSNGVMKRLTAPEDGLFPRPNEIKMSCSCPDWATVCKHVAATMYGVGHRLDQSPELFFALRGVDHNDLVNQATAGSLQPSRSDGAADALVGADLGELFGIELESAADDETSESSRPESPSPRRGRAAAKKRTNPKSKRRSDGELKTKKSEKSVAKTTSRTTRRGGKGRAAEKTIMIEIPVSAARARRRTSAASRKTPK